ncbi:MAG: hypothetical protein KTR24_17095 [Saprospiraceae bacterium]|nr:hypothetical protein [Saprospiraceae bacterium]
MKRKYTKIISIIFTMVISFPLIGQDTVHKTIEESLGDLDDGVLNIVHRRGDVRVEKASGSNATMTLNITITGKYRDEMEEFLKELSVSVAGSGKTKTVEAGAQIKSWNRNLGRSRIKMKNGNVYNGIKKLDLELILAVPDLRKLNVENRYDDIHIATIGGDVVVDLYSGNLYTQDLAGTLESKIKYGKATIGRTSSLDLDLYESEVEAADAGIVEIESKYSELELGAVQNLAYLGYEDEVEVKNIAEKARLEAKYCDFDLGKVGGPLEIEFYETDLTAESAANVKGSCKYGNLDLSKTGHIHLNSDYEMEVKIGECEQLTLDESKYAKISIGSIAKKARVNAYETTIEVEQIEKGFDDLWIDCKYDRMDFPLPDGLGYNLDAEIKYGDLIYDRDRFAKHDYREEGSTTHVVATEDNAKTKVYIRSYETDIILK